jgi:hypothetical protein
MDAVSGSSFTGELSIDTDPIEVVHERLYRKTQQNGSRQQVIVNARVWANKHAFLTGVPELIEILSQDCDG